MQGVAGFYMHLGSSHRTLMEHLMVVEAGLMHVVMHAAGAVSGEGLFQPVLPMASCRRERGTLVAEGCDRKHSVSGASCFPVQVTQEVAPGLSAGASPTQERHVIGMHAYWNPDIR